MARTAKSEGKWSVAAALGLMAVALVWDRIVPPEDVARPAEDGGKFPEDREAERDAILRKLRSKRLIADAGRARPPRSRRADGRTSSGAYTPTSASIESSP